MSQQAELANAMTTKYSASIELWAQQKTCLTEGLCMEAGDTGVENISEDFFGVTTMERVETRDTEMTKRQLNTRRRWVFSDDYVNQIAVAKVDQLRMRVDPNSGIAAAQVAAAMRTKDKVFIDAITAVAYGGKNFATQISFPVAGTLTEGNTGITLGKFDATVEYLKRYGQMEPGDRIWWLWTSAEENAFANILQVASRDYSGAGVRDKGEVTSYGIVDFRRIEDLYDEDGTLAQRMLPYGDNTGTGSADVRTNFAGVKKAMKRWTPGGVRGDVWWNGSKRQWEITTELSIGAARRLDRGIVAIPCITTAP